MEKFDIEGNVLVTAKLKAQTDDSPLALPPPQNSQAVQADLSVPIEEATESFKKNSQIVEEFGDVTSKAIDNLKTINDSIIKTNQNLNSLGQNRIVDNNNISQQPVVDPSDTNILAFIKVLEISGESIKTNTAILNNFGEVVSKIADLKDVDINKSKSDFKIEYAVQNNEDQVKEEIGNDVKQQPLVDNYSDSEQIKNSAEKDNVEAVKDSTDSLKDLNDVMPDLIKQFRHMNSVIAQTVSSLPAVKKIKTKEEDKQDKLSELQRKNFFGLINTGSTAVQSLANLNSFGAGKSIATGASNALDNVASMAKIEEMKKLSKGILAVGAGITAGIAVFSGAKALADAYSKEMPTIFNTGKAFGTTANKKSLSLYRAVNEKNTGTGLEIDEFQSLVQDLRKQGVGNNYRKAATQVAEMANIAQTTARWAYATNGDASQYTQLAGLMSRYGGSKNVSNDFNHLIAAGKASGLNDTQIPEFLSGIQRVMEDGIAKGFSRSATEIADTLLMFSKMSGNNAFWQGEQGAKLLNQANAGIANATALSKTEDIVVYQAFSSVYDDKKMREELGTKETDGTYIENSRYGNMMQMIEGGITPQNFPALIEYVKSTYPDTDAQWEALRNMTGLNYRGSARLLNLDFSKFDTEGLKSELEKITTDIENQNNETKWKQSINDLKSSVVTIGSKVFTLEASGLKGISDNVKRIADKIAPTTVEIYEKDPKAYKEENVILDKESKGHQSLVSDREAFLIGKGMSPEDAKIKAQEDMGKTLDLNHYNSPAITANKNRKGKTTSYDVNPYVKDFSLGVAMLEMNRSHFKDLLANGTVSLEELLHAVDTNDDFRKEFNDAQGFWNNISLKEVDKLTQLMDKIYMQLEEGITVNYTK